MIRRLDQLFHKYWIKWLVYAIACALVHLLVVLLIDNSISILNFLRNIISGLRLEPRNFSEDNLYSAQISSTFIMVTLVSFLSGSGENILWENSVRYSLVNPKVVNFISITVALIINTIFSSVAFWGNLAEIYISFFAIGLVLLVIMTYKMIGAYFDRDALKTKIIDDYERMDEAEKKEALNCIRDRSFHYIDEQKLGLLKENIDFIHQIGQTQYMVEILDYLSKINEELFWIYIKKYNCIENKRTREICEELCHRLVNGRHNNELEQKIIEELYGERQVDAVLEELIIKFSDASFLKKDILQLVFDIFPIATDPMQNIYSPYWWEEFNIDDDIKKAVKENINKPYSELISSYHLPVELLVSAIQKNDIYSVNFILEYMELLRNKFSNMMREYFNDRDHILFDEINKILENEKPDGLSKSDNDAYEYTCQRVLSSYTGYLAFVEVDFLSKRDNEYLRNTVYSQKKYVVLTENIVKRITHLCIDKISM